MTNSSFPYCPNSKPTNAQQTMLRKTAPYQKAQANQIHTTTPLNQMWIIPTFPLPAKFDALREREREMRLGRFARLEHAHTQNNTGINAVLERCGVCVNCPPTRRREKGEQKREKKNDAWCGAVVGVRREQNNRCLLRPSCHPLRQALFWPLLPSPSSHGTRLASLLPPPTLIHRVVLDALLLPLYCSATTSPLHSTLLYYHRRSRLVSSRLDSHCACAVLWWWPRGGRDGRRRWGRGRGGAGAEARRADAAPRQGPAPRRLLLHHQPSSVAWEPNPLPAQFFLRTLPPPRSCRGLSFALCFRLVDRDSDGSPLPRVVFARLLLPRVGGGGLRACVYYYAGVLRCCAWVVAVVVFAREWIDLLELSSLGTWYAFLKAICLFVLFSRLFNNTSH